MLPAEAIISSLERNWAMVDAGLEGLDDASLSRRPTDQCNSIAWILWHMNRVVDTFTHTRLRSMPQLWVKEGWHKRHGMGDDPEDRGVGWSAEQVATWVVPSREVSVSNQQKWDTLGAERSGAGWRSGELPDGPIVASPPFDGLSLHLLPAL